MNSDEENDIVLPESLPVYRKGKEIFDLVRKITDLIPEEDEYLNEIKSSMLCDAALLTVKVAGFNKWDYVIDRWGLFNPPGIGPFDKDPYDDIPFHGFEEDSEE